MDRRRFLGTMALPAAASAPGRDALNVRLPPFGARGDGVTDDTRAIRAAIAAAGDGSVYFPRGVYRCGNLANASANLVGSGMLGTVLRAVGREPVLKLGHVVPHWAYRMVSGMTIDGNAGNANGVSLQSEERSELSGRWAFNGVQFANCHRGVEKPGGNIGNAFVNCLFLGCDFGYHAVSNASPVMHAGNDTFERCHLEQNNFAALYVDSTVDGSGALKLTDTIVEGNPGFGIVVWNFSGQYAPLVFDNVWTEANGMSPTVPINGEMIAPRDALFRNAARVNIVNGRWGRMRLVNSQVLVDGSFLVYPDSIVAEADSSIVYDFPFLDFGLLREGIVDGVPIGPFRDAGVDAPVWRTRPRSVISSEQRAIVASASFSRADAYDFGSGAGVAARSVADGLLFDSCVEVSIPDATATTAADTQAAFTYGKWLVWTLDAKLVRGSAAGLAVSLAGAKPLSPRIEGLLKLGEWISLGGICKAHVTGLCRLHTANATGLPAVIRYSAFQMAQFDTRQQAIDYFNSGVFALAGKRAREVHSDRAPSAGTWSVGDRVWNTAPVASGVMGWVCTAAGSPGTWKSFGAISA